MVTKQTKDARQVRRRNQFIGAHEGAVITEWLNDPQRLPFEEVEQLIGLEAQYRAAGPLQMVDTAKAVCDFFKKVVSRWKLGTAPSVDYDQLGKLSFVQGPTADMRKVPPRQSLAFWKCWELMQVELLTRVRRCKRPGCGTWFFAVFDHAVYHSAECRDQATTSSAEFREHRRKYMRERRKRRTGGK